jgi:endonuclease/exonuclease/phosphatase family metal-dependent hydrolase
MPPHVVEGAPSILEVPPQDVRTNLAALRDGLDSGDGIPAKRLDENLVIGTWNLRAFGGMTEKWQSGPDDTPKRNLADVRAIADIVARFDVVAIQESRGDLKALRHMLKVLGPEWGLILTDTNPPPQGNDERLAFVFDTRRVKPSGLAAELVIPDEWLAKGNIAAGALQQQFVRTPYAVSFSSAGQTFILVTLHVIYGKDAKDREAELGGIAQWLSHWAGQVEDYNQNLMCLGDFNIDREDDPNYQAFTSTGLLPPEKLRNLSRTITDKPGKEHYYDQIAWFTDNGRAKLTLNYTGQAGRFRWTDYILEDLAEGEKSWHISDHYPLWTEFSVREL